LIEAIKSHSLGLETTNWANSYLAFWRVFEILAFGNRIDYKMNDVIKRVCILLGANNNNIREFLNICAEHRNSLVHRGMFPSDGQSIVLTLKNYSALSIMKFLELSNVYHKVNLLDEYYESANSSTKDLLDRKSVIESILAKRNP
jgi:abortive infection bacteriophage resistance protein